MTTFGYARVSTDDQSLDVQRAALKAAGCEMIREEKVSGASRDGRDELAILLDFIRAGDVLIVTKLDRLSRNTVDMLTIIQELGEKGVGFKSLAEPWADTTTPAGKLMLTVFAGVAEFERARLRERQREGIDRAKRNGEISEKTGLPKYAGGKRRHDPAEIKRLKDDKKTHAEIQALLGCSDETIRRALRELESA